MSSADIVTISPDNIQSITTSAWTIMSPSLVNSLSTSQISVLSIDQVTALINSANVASFSISLITALNSLLGITTPALNVTLNVTLNCVISNFCKAYNLYYYKITETDQIDIYSNCLSGCNSSTINYSYSVYINQNSLNYSYSSAIWYQLNSTEINISGWSTQNLTLSALLFQKYPNSTYFKINLNIQNINLSSNGTSEIILIKNQIPINGSCSVSPNNGSALQTNFTITCLNWFDPDGSISNYQFYATFNGSTIPISLGNSSLGSLVTTLPSGSSNYSYSVYLYALIYDDTNVYYQYTLPTSVISQPNNAYITTLTNQLLTDNTLINNLKSASVQSTTSFVNSFATIIDNQGSTTNQVNNINKNLNIFIIIIYIK
jgi:hypothetical protein